MRRHSFKVPGRDCISVPASCPHTPNCAGQYGRHGEEWVYVSTSNDGQTALVLTCYTDILPEGSPSFDVGAPLNKRRYGADMTLHASFPTELESVRDNSPGNSCTYVDEGRCFIANTSALSAHDFFLAHGDPVQFEQSETFWVAFEEQHREKGEEIRGKRVDTTHEQCKGCGGSGVTSRS